MCFGRLTRQKILVRFDKMDKYEYINLHWTEEQSIYHRLYSVIFADNQPVIVSGHTHFGDFKSLSASLNQSHTDILLIGCKTLTPQLIQEITKIRTQYSKLGLFLISANLKYEEIAGVQAHLGNHRGPLAIFLRSSLVRPDQYHGIMALVKMGQVVIDPNLSKLVSTQKDKAALAGGLTGREMEILDLIARGYTNVAISGVLTIDVRTVRHHINSIYSKLQTNGYLEKRHPRVNASNSFLRMTGQVSPQELAVE
jgi:DNA-binding NarL/FixJ family response regulator